MELTQKFRSGEWSHISEMYLLQTKWQTATDTTVLTIIQQIKIDLNYKYSIQQNNTRQQFYILRILPGNCYTVYRFNQLQCYFDIGRWLVVYFSYKLIKNSTPTGKTATNTKKKKEKKTHIFVLFLIKTMYNDRSITQLLMIFQRFFFSIQFICFACDCVEKKTPNTCIYRYSLHIYYSIHRKNIDRELS